FSAALLARFSPRRSTLPNHPSHPPGISHTLMTCGHRAVMPIVYQVPRSSKPTFSSPACWSVCSMYSHWCMPLLSTISWRNKSRSAAMRPPSAVDAGKLRHVGGAGVDQPLGHPLERSAPARELRSRLVATPPLEDRGPVIRLERHEREASFSCAADCRI